MIVMVKASRVKKQNTKSKYLALLFVIAIVVLCLSILYVKKHKNTTSSTPAATTGTINLKPATAEDKQRVDQTKNTIVQKDESIQQQGSSSSKKSVTPTITYANQSPNGEVEIDGYVSGVYEDGGTCTATLKLNGATVTRDVQAVKNVNSVNCPAIVISKDSFATKGSWTVALSYTSNTAAGISTTKQIVIQ